MTPFKDLDQAWEYSIVRACRLESCCCPPPLAAGVEDAGPDLWKSTGSVDGVASHTEPLRWARTSVAASSATPRLTSDAGFAIDWVMTVNNNGSVPAASQLLGSSTLGVSNLGRRRLRALELSILLPTALRIRFAALYGGSVGGSTHR